MTDNNPSLLTKKDIEHLKFISETNRTLHNQRVRHELQVVIASVTFYVASLGFKLAKPNMFPTSFWGKIWVLVGFFVLAWTVFLYMRGSANANERNQKAAMNAEDLIVDLLKNRPVDVLHEINAKPINPGDVILPDTLEKSFTGFMKAFGAWVSLGVFDVCHWCRDGLSDIYKKARDKRRSKGNNHTNVASKENSNNSETDSRNTGGGEKRYNLNRWLWQARFVLAVAIFSGLTIWFSAIRPIQSRDGAREIRKSVQSQRNADQTFNAAIEFIRQSGGVKEAKEVLSELEKSRDAIGEAMGLGLHR